MGSFAKISMSLSSQPTAPRPTANLPRDLFIPTSGVGIMIHVFAETLGWATGYKKCGPVPGRNSLDDELDGCAMLMNNLSQWIDKCMRERQWLSGHSPAQSIFWRNALHPGGPLPASHPHASRSVSGSGVRGFGGSGEGRGSGIQSVKRQRIDRGQQVQSGWVARSRLAVERCAAYPQHNGINITVRCGNWSASC